MSKSKYKMKRTSGRNSRRHTRRNSRRNMKRTSRRNIKKRDIIDGSKEDDDIISNKMNVDFNKIYDEFCSNKDLYYNIFISSTSTEKNIIDSELFFSFSDDVPPSPLKPLKPFRSEEGGLQLGSIFTDEYDLPPTHLKPLGKGEEEISKENFLKLYTNMLNKLRIQKNNFDINKNVENIENIIKEMGKIVNRNDEELNDEYYDLLKIVFTNGRLLKNDKTKLYDKYKNYHKILKENSKYTEKINKEITEKLKDKDIKMIVSVDTFNNDNFEFMGDFILKEIFYTDISFSSRIPHDSRDRFFNKYAYGYDANIVLTCLLLQIDFITKINKLIYYGSIDYPLSGETKKIIGVFKNRNLFYAYGDYFESFIYALYMIKMDMIHKNDKYKDINDVEKHNMVINQLIVWFNQIEKYEKFKYFFYTHQNFDEYRNCLN